MADPAELPDAVLERSRDLGAVMYCSAYIRLMARRIGIDDASNESVNAMVLQMVEPMNHATEAIWRAMMNDNRGMQVAFDRFRESLKNV